MTQPIPNGFNAITPTLVVKNAAKSIDTYQKAFGAQELYRMNCPQTGKVAHACLQIGDSKIFITDEFPEMGAAAGSNLNFYLYIKDVDAAFAQAKKAGLKEKSPPEDMFWGDRVGKIADSDGITWSMATHVRDVSDDEMAKAMKDMAKKSKAA